MSKGQVEACDSMPEDDVRALVHELQVHRIELERQNEQLRRAWAEVRRLNKRMEFILGATKTGLNIIDADFNMQYIDPEWQKVYGDPAGRKCYEYFMGRTEACPGCGIPVALATKRVVVTEEVLVKEDNRPIQVTTIPFQSEDGRWLVAEVNVDISDRKRMEEELRAKTVQLEEANTALRVVLRQRGEDKRESQEGIVSDLKSVLIPHVERLRNSRLDAAQETYLDLIEARIRDIASSFSRKLSTRFHDLTPAEIQVADLIREGKTNKEIANFLRLSEHTITFHRRNLRRKFGIAGREESLLSHLRSFGEE